jgi:hypothetical protein
MSTPGKPRKPYSGRRPDAIAINTTVDRDAVAILKQYCQDGRRGLGRFISRLAYEHQAREQERMRVREQIEGILQGANTL